MSRKRHPDRIKAEEIYLEHNGDIELVKIAEILGRPPGTIRGWKNKDSWDDKLDGTFQDKKENKVERSRRKKGGQPGNKNAVGNSGGAAPEGNLNAIKHGAYQSVYADMLNTEDKILFNMVQSTTDINEEIKLLRFKIARLLSSEVVFEDGVEKKISETVRINGINACMDQLRRLIELKAKLGTDTEKLQLDKEKFEFQKSKTDIDADKEYKKAQIEKLKAQIQKIKGISDDIEDTSELRRLLLDE